MKCHSFHKFFTVLILVSTFSFLVKGQSEPPYQVNWINRIGVNQTGDILTKNVTTVSWTNSGAISSNILPANTDGWIEFSTASGSYFAVGFAIANTINVTQFTNGLVISSSGCGAQEGLTGTYLTSWQVGDVFRISREGNLIKYYRNGNELRAVAVDPALELKIKATLPGFGNSTPAISASFDMQLILQPTVSGLDGDNGSGSISLNVIGGVSPYSYSWASGEETSSITKAKGSYSVMVTDAEGRTQTRTYNLGYKINWIDRIGVNQSGDILTKNVTGGWTNSGAISSNILSANTDGWMEFYTVSNSYFSIGLAINNTINYTQFTDGIVIDHSSGYCTGYKGTTFLWRVNWQIGDIFRISREGSLVKYYRNDTLLHSVGIDRRWELRVKTSLPEFGRSTPNITASFDMQLALQATVTGLAGNSGVGGISLDVIGGTAPYNYNWSSGEGTSSITKPKGTYSVMVSDAAGRSQERTYSIGYKVDWINRIGVNTTGDVLTKNITTTSWTNSGAVSSNILPANMNGWIEFTTTTESYFAIGLTINNTINYTQFSNSLLVNNATGHLSSFEGAGSMWLGTWQAGDVFRISREGSVVTYYRNGAAIRSVNVSPSLALKIKVSIPEYGRSTPSITSSFWLSDGIVRTYYSIANGNWATPSIWSLSENGPPSTVYPDNIDKVVIKGHEVAVTSNIKSSGITITSTNENTRLVVDGNMGVLTVVGNIIMNRENSTNTAEVLLVQNEGRLDIKN